ncbi:CHASE domain-containing protein [Rhodoferax saidenbachensis]|uniref:histidine kinase n=1 Tax=Rhodoferax saidenbachensis TaxID=1484693 RepID=A0ABU1ZTW4_9BURK|nr:CHASE domain-containing protein [Rhodoferax saidenbachensis]MDR7308933.1 signal transduction histidine kinase [Rhodoferax saidenbachensis]
MQNTAPAPSSAPRTAPPVLGRLRFLSYVLPAVVLGLALTATWFFWEREHREIGQVLQGEFDARVRETTSLFRERMLAYEQALRATHGLFATSDNVQRGDFQSFVANLRIQNHPGLQGMGFALIVPSAERERHIAAVRSQGFPAYTVQPPSDTGASTSALYFEPSGSSFLSTLGTDFFLEPSRRPAMEAARDSDGIAISNKVKLPEEDAAQVQAGYRMYLPVYQNGKPHSTLAERRAHIKGWIYAAFSMDGLMDNILGERANITVEVYDGAGQDDDQLIDTYSDRVGGESTLTLFYTTQQVEVGGYGWTLTAHSLPNFTTEIAISRLQWVARLGVVASVMAALLTWFVLMRRMRGLRAAADLRIAKEQAEAASHAKSQFLAVASHDLRQPIQALSLFVATLQAMSKRVELTGAEVGHIAARLQMALNGLGRLLNGLFDLSRLDSGTVTVTQRPVDMADLLTEVGNAFAGPAQAKGLDFRVVMPHGLWVETDPLVLARVLSNLVANAVRYTEQGRILVGCRRHAQHVELQVLDTGIGIAQEECDRIFGEFYQVPNVARDREHGLGLGLAIVSRSVQLLGGQIQVRSKPGKGSMFSITLPRAPAPELPVSRPADPQGPFAGSVLVIDDDPELRESMQRLLAEWKHSVLVAASLEDALALAGSHQNDIRLILSDYRLASDVTGIHAIQAVTRRLARKVPAVIITGDTSAQPIAEAAQHGLRLVYKPVEPQVLADLMSSIP